MRLLAPAKINLHLRVAPADGLGFHPLMSWMCTVGLFDTLTIECGDAGELSLECDDPALPTDQSNLVLRAARTMQERMSSKAPGARLRLEKRIPTGGGLGGGSSDAARTLLGLNKLWKLNWPVEVLSKLAEQLGSDVPFFLRGPSSLCAGRGELVRPLARPGAAWAVLIFPGWPISTAAVYDKFDEMHLGDPGMARNPPDWQQWTELSAGPLLARLVNDLERPAFALCPQLAQLRQQIEQLLGRIVRMSGSGSSLFTLFDDFPAAQSAVACIEDRHQVRAVAAPVAPAFDDELEGNFEI